MCVPNKLDVIELFNQYNLRLIKGINTCISLSREKLNNLKNSYVLKNPMSLYEKLEQNFDHLYERLIIAIKGNIQYNNERLKGIKTSFVFTNPNMLFIDKAYNYNDLVKRLTSSIKQMFDNNKNIYLNLLSKLEVLNPITTLKRGYSVTKCNNKIVMKTKDVKIGDRIVTDITNGKIESEVKNIYEETRI